MKTIAEFFRKEVDPLFKNNYDAYEDSVTGRFTDPDGDVDLLIVKDKLLTGFDAPIAAVLYVDKNCRTIPFCRPLHVSIAFIRTRILVWSWITSAFSKTELSTGSL